MKRLLYIFLALPLFTSCGEKRDTLASAPIPEISVARPLVQHISLTKEYPGYLTAEQTVDLVARVSGTLQTVSFKPGSKVKKGELLFVIEPVAYKNNVTQAEAALSSSRAQLEYARNNYTRMREASKSDAVSRIQVLQAESTVAEQMAAVSNAEAALNTARTNLSYCYIRAPFDGTISKNVVDVGSYIGGSMQPTTLATLYKEDRMYTYFHVADNQWLKMLANLSAKTKSLPKELTVKLGKEGSRTYPATLDYLSPNIDVNTGTLLLRARLDNPDGILKSGLYVSITLPYAEKNEAVLVDASSIGTDQLGKYLYVVNDSNIVNYRHISVGQMIGDTLQQITDGLLPHEYYVTKALMKVREGMKVNPVP